ncbi:hypothetical protein P691DRAFT_805241 [Macrolepiota fuliginosa MF-IS2]|uniref:Tetraspanin Tsp2 n=1 Tax=Macrolepiota fuliginosa MF-IS2 TaxID=1400762 RepID=A0A9P5X778_9AGAR|nr:hypothetical protein P691DRAFT_805241 [Macrolepiota fuliginosa MF-IS2]
MNLDHEQHRQSSRRASVISHANSAYSQAGSTRHILADMNTSSDFAAPSTLNSSPLAGLASGLRSTNDASSVSLSVNYIPSKFSDAMLSPAGPRRRKGAGGFSIPKPGGGVEAFRSGEARMPGANDEDYDGIQSGVLGAKDRRTGRRMRWTRFKWILFFANIFLTIYSLTALIFCLLTWFNIWTHADIVRVGNRPELVLSTIAASLGVFVSLIGWAGILLNNRAFLAWYTFLLWIAFAFLVTPGYITYKRRAFNLEGKVNAQWSRDLGADGRLRIQDQLECCGYFSPFIEATISQTCYARSILPGCKLPYMTYERMVLERWYTVVFSLVPLHIGIMLAGLLCSNHVTYRFGKGMMPKAYRLSMNSMAVIMDGYAQQLAEQYGNDVATDILSRSRSNLNLSAAASPFSTGAQQPATTVHAHAKYESVSSRPN